MALFTKRDRIAIACIAIAILFGWIVRYSLYQHKQTNKLRVIRNAVEIPAILESAEKHSTVLVNINTADEQELEKLPMIGPVKAADIITYRQKHGSFEKKPDVMNVHGIGQATYEKIKDYITVNQ